MKTHLWPHLEVNESGGTSSASSGGPSGNSGSNSSTTNSSGSSSAPAIQDSIARFMGYDINGYGDQDPHGGPLPGLVA
jgi:hypothetical protein